MTNGSHDNKRELCHLAIDHGGKHSISMLSMEEGGVVGKEIITALTAVSEILMFEVATSMLTFSHRCVMGDSLSTASFRVSIPIPCDTSHEPM